MLRRLALLLFSCAVISGCTATVRHRSSLAPTHPSTGLNSSQMTAVVAPRSLSTNYLAPPRHTNEVWNGNKETSTFEAGPSVAHYNGTPRLAGTVVRNSARPGPHKALIRKPVTAAEPSEPRTASVQAGQIADQPGSISVTSVALDTQGPPTANAFASPNAFSLPGIFGILVVLALGILGMIWFLGHWKSLNPSSWSGGEGTYSDDSQGSPPEEFSKIVREGANGSRPKEDIKANSRN